ncbi:hypothetical protein [Streptomyces rimosus]|uniref:hypothetical protein n=1 Tax=Streptomyces rimosus TaxID=1927 RepID=UPI0004C62B16|nr:hypothetical protein [Streptomyces rimosus]
MADQEVADQQAVEALEERRRQSAQAHADWLARRPSWHDWGPRQATDPRKRRAMEGTGRYADGRRDV